MKPWFDAIVEKCFEHRYPFEHCYNMNESRFAIGASQLSKTLVNVREKSNWKVIQGKQK